MTRKEILHLYWRAGFGITFSDAKKLEGSSRQEMVTQLFKSSQKSTPLSLKIPHMGRDEYAELSREEKAALRKMGAQKLLELNYLWVKKMSDTGAMLRERMTLFWHDHFACHSKNPALAEGLNNTIREHALGKFSDLLMGVSKSPAMILFLNNQQNRKRHPNENFAREVMELFTLGRDNGYSELDIKEAARAFTGWSVNNDSEFYFRDKVHDVGRKTVLGQSGNFKGEDIITILVGEEQTARYITEKIYKYFVNHESPDANAIDKWSQVLYNSGMDIGVLMKEVFTSDHFYKEVNMGTKIKSPIDFLIGLNRQFGMSYEDPKVVIMVQKMLNQLLFHPPNVAGWPGGRHWIDNSTLMLRLKIPSVALNDGVIEYFDKGDMPEAMIQQYVDKQKAKLAKKFKADPDWNFFKKDVKGGSREELVEHLIVPRLGSTAKRMVSLIHAKDVEDYVVQVLSLPEYQMC